MSEWQKVKLGDCISTKKGFAFKSALYTNCGVPVVRVSDFTLDSVADNDLVYYPHAEKDRYDEYVLNEGDVLIQTVGSWQYNPNSVVGKVVRVPYYHKGSLLNQNIVKIIPNNGYNNAFIFYRLKCRDFAGHVLGEARGAANQASITLDTIKRFSFDCPLLSTQQRIATILSRYDSLIENYRKQIKLLEEAAQRLYKEWFIDLRFPGHENTKIVDGVPEGWEKKKLHEIAEVVMGSSPKSEFYNNDKQGLPFHQGVGSYGTRFVDDNVYSTSITRLAEPNSILFSVRAPVGRLNITKNKIIIGRGLAAMNHKDGFQSFLFYMLKERFFMDNIIGNGSIFASISKVELLDQEFIVPPMITIMAFESLSSKLDKKIQGVDTQLRLLTEARDRLLPKLMSGEIEI